MSVPRRSARIAARETNRAYSLRALNTVADTLQKNLDLLDQVAAVKVGWITFMMSDMICNGDDIQSSIDVIILMNSSLPPFSKDDRKQLRLLSKEADRTRALMRTIRGGDHRPLDNLEEITHTMLNTVKALINKIA